MNTVMQFFYWKVGERGQLALTIFSRTRLEAMTAQPAKKAAVSLLRGTPFSA